MERKITRRQFIKVGALFLPAMGIFRTNPVLARWWAMQGHSGGVNTSWFTWDQKTETGWGSSLVNIYLMENTLAGGDETSYGIVTGADLVWTEVGGLAGATVSGGISRRLFDGANDTIYCSDNLAAQILNVNPWLILIKANISPVAAQGIFGWDGTGNQIDVYTNADGTLTFSVTAGGALKLNATTTAGISATDTLIWVGGDGTNTYGGWSTTKPTTHIAVPSTQRVQAASYANFTNWTATRHYIMARYDASQFQAGSVYYAIVGKTAFIPYS